MGSDQITIYVFADWLNMSEPMLLGELKASKIRGKEVFSFEYDKAWLQSSQALTIDPELQLYSGQQYLNDTKGNFGIFLDSSPDRWGRLLMRRRQAAIARKEQKTEKKLFETDYLLGVYDQNRMGGLRFKTNLQGEFLDNNHHMAAPPWTSLRELEHASLKLEENDVVSDPDYLNWLNLLIAPGSSLGGARPKASVTDKEKNLWIAKFPSRYDELDIAAWEMVVLELAKNAGICVAEGQIKKFTGRHHTFLTKRFDRTSEQRRVHFASAMTLLGYMDGVSYHEGVSYLELAEFITQHCINIAANLEQLWRRIVFSIAVSNTDDHLRNHGFLLTEQGWELSPAYDLNPNPTGSGLTLNISENDNALDFELALSVREYFRLSDPQAKKILKEIQLAVSRWEKIADKFTIAKSEQAQMAAAFHVMKKI